MDNISPSPEFRTAIIAILLYTDWLQRYGTILRPEYFPVKGEQDAVKWFNDYYEEYGAVPSDTDAADGLFDNPLLGKLDDVADDDLRYAADQALEFAKLQAMKLAVLEAVDDIRDGDLIAVRDRVETALAVGQDRLDLGTELVAGADDWMYDELRRKRHPTGWPRADAILQGGLVAGEYGLIMAPTGRGKTTALINIGFALAGLLGATNVLHITYEMPAQKVLKRYAVRLTGIPLLRDGDSGRYKRELERHAGVRLRGRLRVARPGRTVADISCLIDNLASDGFDVGALIVDYADLMVSHRRRKEYRFELADIARELRALGDTRNMPVWSATQSGRHTLYKEVITEADIAEAIEKAAIADVIIAICQTREEEELEVGRLYMAKVRDARSRMSIPVKLNFELQTITQSNV